MGRVQAYDGPIYIADAALYLMSYATRPWASKTPTSSTRTSTRRLSTLLRQQRELIGRYWHDAFIQIDDFTNEGVAASSTWPFQTNVLQAGGAPIDKVVPDEGATGWADTTMLSSNAPHPNCAYMWMEHSLNPKLQGDLAAWFGTVPAVPAACEGNELLGPDGLRQQRERVLRRDPVLEDPDRRLQRDRVHGVLRPLLPVGHRLPGGDRRTLSN